MLSDFVFLDYVWRGLLLGAMTSTIFLFVMCFSPIFCRGWGRCQTKWYFNIHFAFLLITFLGGFAFVSWSDPELAAGCFTQFIKGGTSFALTRYIAALWLLGAMGLVFWDAIRAFASLKRVRSFPQIEDPILKGALKEMARRIGVRRPLDLGLTRAPVSPFVFGFFKHKVVLPQKLVETGSLETLRSVFAHELIHVRDQDSIWLAVGLLCRRFLFFHPLIYPVGRTHSAVIEKAADEQAVRKGQIKARQLVSSLFEIVAFCQDGSSQPMKVNASRTFHEMKERIEALRAEGQDQSRTRFGLWMLASVTIAGGFSAAQADMRVVRMCNQVQHERLIESWLQMVPEPMTCLRR